MAASEETRATAREQRRADALIRGLSHAAIRVRDMEVTRAFYEDILGLPLVYARVGQSLHTFFEMGSGYVAFLEFPEDRPWTFKQPGDDLETHFAMQVDRLEDVKEFERRLKEAGWPCFTRDHSWCFSLYFNDPDAWHSK